MYIIIVYIILGGLSVSFLVFFYQAISLRKSIQEREGKIIWLYEDKINKIPALIEIMSKYTSYTDIFIEIIHLHKIAIISRTNSIYDLLENNGRIHREFLFLMKVSAHIWQLHKDGNFLYIRDFIIFYESTINKELLYLDSDIIAYNRVVQRKNLTLIGLVFPLKKHVKISNT